jgi:hypothetical protein
MAPASSASSTMARIFAICAALAAFLQVIETPTRSVVWPTSRAQLVAAGFPCNSFT